MKVKFAFALLSVCLFFSGCGFAKPECAVEIITNHSQYIEEEGGVVSGIFSETFTVTEGDVFYESNYGNWVLNPEDRNKYHGIIAEITKVGESGITAIIYGVEKTIGYNTGFDIPSDMVIYDGPSYDYVMTVSKYSE